uniref:Uncharacterized protein n=1 Tax=Noccaea caerulescens TaxID=107243 RepID=A0A1J3F632_NOCCA
MRRDLLHHELPCKENKEAFFRIGSPSCSFSADSIHHQVISKSPPPDRKTPSMRSGFAGDSTMERRGFAIGEEESKTEREKREKGKKMRTKTGFADSHHHHRRHEKRTDFW